MAGDRLYDCLIVGAGPAGLSVAQGLARVNRSCAVFSNDKFRNAGAHHAHAVLSRDHVNGRTICAMGKEQIQGYGNTDFITTEISDVVVESTQQSPNYSVVNQSGRRWTGRTLVLATGIRDVLPEIEGYAHNWPENIYQCLFCDGYERRSRPVGVLCYPCFDQDTASTATMLHFMCLDTAENPANTASQSTRRTRSKVTIFTNGPPNPSSDPAILEALNVCAAHRMYIDTRKVLKLEKIPGPNGGVKVHLLNEDSTATEQTMAFLSHKPRTEMVGRRLFERLGLEIVSSPLGDHALVQPPFQSTSKPGVFVSGDVSTSFTHSTSAMFTGMASAVGVAHYCDRLDDMEALMTLNSRDSQYCPRN